MTYGAEKSILRQHSTRLRADGKKKDARQDHGIAPSIDRNQPILETHRISAFGLLATPLGSYGVLMRCEGGLAPVLSIHYL
jgi:hypothetical protein